MGKIHEYPLEATVLQDTDFADLDAFNSGTGLFQSKKISGLNLKDSVLTFITPNLNARDTANRDRANHTGTQDASTITGLAVVATSNDYNDLDNLPVLLTAHSELILDDGTNPHGTTSTDVGLGNVDNTSDLNKPISTATQLALDDKQDELISGVNIKTIDGQSVLGAGDIPITIPAGVFGISDSSGVYTYYATLTLAMAAAVAGQTIEMFADVVETGAVTVTLKNEVNINFNGHTYTLDSATTDSCFLTNSNVTASFFNGTVRRINGTSGFNSYCLGGTGSAPRNIYSYGVKYENTFGIAVHNPNSNSNMYNIDAYGVTYGIYNNSGNVYNSQGSATTGSGVHSQNGGKYFSCIGKSTSGDGVTGTGGQFISCTGFSSSGNGINFNGSIGISCTGYSSTLDGIVSTSIATLTDCSGYSASRYGVNLTGVTAGSNIYGYSASNNGVRISSGSGSQIINSVKAISDLNIALFVQHNGTSVIVSDIYAHSKWNNTGGHAVEITGTSSNKILKGGTLIVTNSSANCIFSAAAQTWKYLQLAFIGATTPTSANITQGQLNIEDNYGNILIG